MNDRRGPAEEPDGPEYRKLADLARRTRPGAPPQFADRVMRAVRQDAAPEYRSILDVLRRAFAPGASARTPRLVMAVAFLALALFLASLVSRPRVSDRNGTTKDMASDVSDPGNVLHRFEYVAPEAQKVCLVGDFNGWELCRIPLVKDDRTGAWAVLVPLPPGRHEYMFVVDDNSWVTDPTAPVQVDDGFGNRNAVLFL